VTESVVPGNFFMFVGCVWVLTDRVADDPWFRVSCRSINPTRSSRVLVPVRSQSHKIQRNKRTPSRSIVAHVSFNDTKVRSK
jgi:hypothetical protein